MYPASGGVLDPTSSEEAIAASPVLQHYPQEYEDQQHPHDSRYHPPSNSLDSHDSSYQFSMSGFVLPDGSGLQKTSPSRRRRSNAGGDSVKHRRTRSGCFTCRTRRVKCDETHPICERCRKGGRECTYPEVVPTPKLLSSGKRREKHSSTASREGSSSMEDLEEDDGTQDGLSPPSGGLRLKSSASLTHLRGAQRRGSLTSSSDQSRRNKNKSPIDPSPSPRDGESSAPTSPAGSLRQPPLPSSLVNSADGAHLPHDVAFYLNYHEKKLTCHHYMMKDDACYFFKARIFEYAVKDDALLYAIAAFASFHYSVFFKTGAFQTFLEYYNKAVALLRVSLSKLHSITTVVTILQLATFEEYLGDWASLMEHRNAASKIINSLWTPDTMAEAVELRLIFNWFSHFDLIAAMMAGHKATVGPEWSLKTQQVVQKKRKANPDDVDLKIEEAQCTFRDLAMEVSMMTAKRTQGRLTSEEFRKASQQGLQLLYDWWNNLDPAIMQEYDNMTLPANVPPEDVCPFRPARLYKGTRWPVNFMICDYYGLIIMLKHQIALTNGSGVDSSLHDYAIKICGILAAIEAFPEAPAGSLLASQAPIGLAALWVPDLPGYRRWMQKQLAKAEQMGFVYPLAFRSRISEIWGDPQVKHTWVMNSSETAIGLTIRQLVDMRDAEFPRDPAGQDIKSMRTLMTEMRLDSKGSGHVPPPPSPTQNLAAVAPPCNDKPQFSGPTSLESTDPLWR